MENQGSSTRHTCIYCKASYLYQQINDDGSLKCHNCGKIFYSQTSVDIQGEQLHTAPSRVTKRKIAGIRVKCPSCMATYIYRDEHQIGDNKVQCQNCASSIEASGDEVFIIEETTEKDTNSCDIATVVLILVLLLFVPWIFAIPLMICILVLRTGASYTTRVEKKEGIDIG